MLLTVFKNVKFNIVLCESIKNRILRKTRVGYNIFKKILNLKKCNRNFNIIEHSTRLRYQHYLITNQYDESWREQRHF